MTVANNENHGGHELDDGDTAQESESAGQEVLQDETAQGVEEDQAEDQAEDLIENEEADPTDVVAATDPKHEQKFRWWALGVIAGLCVFFALATLLVAALASGEAAGQIASDMAKTAIPTLLTLLGTAVAWAFKSEKD